MEPLRQRVIRWRSRMIGALRERCRAWLKISRAYLPSFQILGALATAAAAIFTAFALRANLENLKLAKLNAATPSCREAERLLDEIGEAISPSFPHQLCRMAIGKEQIPWDRIEDLLTRAAPLVDHCDSVETAQGRALSGRFLMAKALRARADSTSSEGAESYRRYKEEAAEKLAPDRTLVALRDLEDHIDRLDKFFEEELDPDQDPCLTPAGEGWKKVLSKTDEIFAEPTWQQGIASTGLRGCLWMLRGEQAYWQAGLCSEDDITRRLQAILSFRNAMELAQRGENLYPPIVEVQRSQVQSWQAKSSLAKRQEVAWAVNRLNYDAWRWGTEAVRTRDVLKERRILLLDQQKKYMEQRAELGKAVEKGRNFDGYLEELYLADLLTYMREPHAVPELLAGTVHDNDSHRSDFRYHVVIAKALCFGGEFEGSLRSFDLAAALETAELADRWGSARVLRPLCALAASRGSASELPSLSGQEQVDVEVCTVREVAPALEHALRQHGAGRWLDQFDDKRCREALGGTG